MAVRRIWWMACLSMLLATPLAMQFSSAAKAEEPTMQNAAITEDSPAVELAYWNTIKDSKSAEEFEAYLNRYPNGMFADLAKIRYEALAGHQFDSSKLPAPEPAKTEEPAQASQGGSTDTGVTSKPTTQAKKKTATAKKKSVKTASSKKSKKTKSARNSGKSKKTKVANTTKKKKDKSLMSKIFGTDSTVAASNKCSSESSDGGCKKKSVPRAIGSDGGGGGAGGGGGGNSGGGWGG